MAGPTPAPHILCMDDVPAVLRVLREVLEEAGYRVTTWTTADEDLDDVVALAPDMIVVDYRWGQDKTSWAFLQWLKLDHCTLDHCTLDHRTLHTPVLLLSGALHLLGERREALRRMDIVMIRKPFDLDELVQTIETMLPRPGPREGRLDGRRPHGVPLWYGMSCRARCPGA
jgi:CheY-like chemotaxis protein